MFQGKFSITTPALISGAVAERMRFRTFLVFTVVWATIVYCPLAQWVWASDGSLFTRAACSTSRAAPSRRALATEPNGAVGDGKIFVMPLEEVARIRTGERGGSAS